MNSSSLLSVLKTFSAKEMKKFGEFVRSPFFNKNENIIAIYDYLEKYHPVFPESKVQKEKVHAKIFRNEKYDDGRMRFFISELLKLATEFLVIINNENNPISKSITLAKEYSERKQFKLSAKVLEQAGKDISINPPHYSLTQNEWLLDEMKVINFLSNDMHKKNLVEDYVKEINPFRSLTRNFLYQYLNMSFYFASKQNDFQYTIDSDVPEKIYDVLRKNLDENDPLIKLKYLKFKLTVGSGINDIKQLENLLEQDYEKIPEVDRRNAYAAIINVYNKMTLAGKPIYRKDTLKIYKKLLEHNLLTHDGYFLAVPFNNIVFLSFLLKEEVFLRGFINKYKDLLKEDEKESLANYAHACLNFCTKDYTAVLKHLSKGEPVSFYQKLHERILYILVFYELNDEEPFQSHLNSTKRFLEIDTNMAALRKKRYEDFIHFAGLIYKARNVLPVNESKISKIREEIESNMQIEYKDWLLEKLEELK
jgi:hypothetical protein